MCQISKDDLPCQGLRVWRHVTEKEEYMKKRMSLLVLAVVIDLGLGVYAIGFSGASVAVRASVAGIMCLAIVHEVFDAMKIAKNQETEHRMEKRNVA